MGTWGTGNFDCDEAMDLVGDLNKEVTNEMKEPEFVEDVDLVMAAVAIRLALVRSCHASPPKRTEIEKLRRSVLKIYDEQIDGLSPKPDYKKGRRSVIDRTFRDFLKVLDERP